MVIQLDYNEVREVIVMDYQIRLAHSEDLNRIEEIYAHARAFMARTGNPSQWGGGYPRRQRLEEDIRENSLYVLTREGEIHGVFFFAIGPDRTYQVIENGCWHSDSPYGVIHRIAGDGSGGIFPAALAFCRGKISHLRIDTHGDNQVMQHVLKKHGFRPCGWIKVEDGTARIAFELVP